MHRLARVKGTQAFLAALALGLVGFFAPGWYGAVILFALVAGLFVVLLQTRTRSAAGTTAVRLAVLAGVVAIALHKVI